MSNCRVRTNFCRSHYRLKSCPKHMEPSQSALYLVHNLFPPEPQTSEASASPPISKCPRSFYSCDFIILNNNTGKLELEPVRTCAKKLSNYFRKETNRKENKPNVRLFGFMSPYCCGPDGMILIHILRYWIKGGVHPGLVGPWNSHCSYFSHNLQCPSASAPFSFHTVSSEISDSQRRPCCMSHHPNRLA